MLYKQYRLSTYKEEEEEEKKKKKKNSRRHFEIFFLLSQKQTLTIDENRLIPALGPIKNNAVRIVTKWLLNIFKFLA